MGELPSGRVTFLVTDVVGSTALWERHGDAVRRALTHHDDVLRELSAPTGGVVFQRAGDGAYVAFTRPDDAVAVAATLQTRLASAALTPSIDVRVGIHTGDAEPVGDEYLGPAINRAVRVCDAAHGGQVLLSGSTATLLAGTSGAPIVPLGEYWLKGIADPQRLHQLGDAPFPPPRSAAVAEVVLPAWSTSLVGRADDVAAVAALLEDQPVVTLTGIGGIGKTRVAVEVARQAAASFPDGVWFVDLTAVRTDEEVRDKVAGTIGLPAGVVHGGSTVDSARFLRDRRALLVLDNCEHVVAGAAIEAGRLARGCSDLRIIATSRERLRCGDEHVVALAPLRSRSDAVTLFVERARAAQPSFVAGGVERTLIAGLCERLDGIPLAIELAAARCRHAELPEIVAGVHDRMGLLTGGDRSLPRHSTLRSMLDWSHELLTAAEQALLRRLAVFPQPFTVDAARAVGADADEVLNLLGSLVDRSLVVYDGDGRYRLLDTVRTYASEQLALAGENDEVARRHRDWVRDLCHRHHPADASLAGAESAVLADDANIVQALRWSLDCGELDVAADLSRFMWMIFQRRGELDLARGMYRDAFREQWSVDPDIHADIGALFVHAEIWMGDLTDTDSLTNETAGVILGAPNPERGLALGAILQAAVQMHRHGIERDAVLGVLDRAREQAERSGSPTLVDVARMARAAVLMHDGAYDDALRIAAATQHPMTTARGMQVGALVLLGRYDDAVAVLASVDERDRRGAEWLWEMLELLVHAAARLPDTLARAVRLHRQLLVDQPSPVMVRNVAASLALVLNDLGARDRARTLAARVRGVVTVPGLTTIFDVLLRDLGLPSPPPVGRADPDDDPTPIGVLVDDALAWLESTAVHHGISVGTRA